MIRYPLLVATREYAENVKTKGFWIGVLLFPIILVAAIKVPQLLEEKATPTRHFFLVDESGQFERVVEEALERDHARRVLKALGQYASRHASSVRHLLTAEQLENMPAGGLEEQIKQWLDENEQAVEAFLGRGGLQAALAQMKPLLRDDAPEFEEPRRRFVRAELPPGVDRKAAPRELARQLKPYLLGEKRLSDNEELFAFIFIPDDAIEQLHLPGDLPVAASKMPEGAEPVGIQYWSTNLTDTDLRKIIERGVNKELRKQLYGEEGIDAATVERVQGTRAIFTALNPKKEEGKETVSLADRIRQWAPVVFVYLLFVALMTTVQMLLNNTVEEKSNRIIEVLLSSVTPGELMRGKLLGIAGVGLTMVGTWILSIVVVLHLMAGPEVQWVQVAFQVLQSSGLLAYFAAYFVLGYLLYAGFFLVLGSICNSLKEAQNLMGPVVMVMIVPLLTMMFVPKDPNGTLATVLSWIPIYTPFLMMNRAAADPPLFDLVGTGVLLVVTIAVVLWLTGKIFRIAILRTGQPPKILELLRWIRG